MATALQRNNFADKTEFLPRIAQADKSAAQECVDVYGAMLWELAKQLTNSNEAAEKAVQEIFIDIWENAAFCDLAISDEEVWIAMIARRRLAQYSLETTFQTQINSASRILPNRNNGIVA